MSSPVATKGGSPSVETAMTGANSRIKVTNRVYQVNGGSDLVGDHLVGMRPSNATANALRAGFHRVAHRALPLPVGSSDRVVR
jgi:hypothetical protein